MFCPGNPEDGLQARLVSEYHSLITHADTPDRNEAELWTVPKLLPTTVMAASLIGGKLASLPVCTNRVVSIEKTSVNEAI
jgi:hypothetical protein